LQKLAFREAEQRRIRAIPTRRRQLSPGATGAKPSPASRCAVDPAGRWNGWGTCDQVGNQVLRGRL